MPKKYLRPLFKKRVIKRLILVNVLCFPLVLVYAEEALSESFLQFLIEFEDVDDDLISMMIENGIRDIEKENMTNEKQVESEANDETK